MQRVLENISKQSGYDFVYSTSDLKELKATNIDLNNVTIETALKACFANQPLQYEIADKTVMIKRKADPTFLERLADRWAAIDVHGRVVDQEGKPLPGATVKVKGTGKSVSTNAKGEFYLEKVEEGVVLVISFIGYVNKEVSASREMENVVLDIATGELEEQVIKGYYTTTKELNTGSVGTLKAADIAKQPVSDPLMALSGRIPGVYVSQTSGIPGAYVNLNIRGKNSLSNGSDPLYVVDGVPFNSQSLSLVETSLGNGTSPFTSLRPEDIESMDILKDADATAIYGSRGANGVVLITTKRGKAGRTNITANIYHGISYVSNHLDLMNTKQFLEMRKEALTNDNLMPESYEYDINGTWDQSRYTDWQKVLIGGNAGVTNANLTISGGTAQTQFLFGTSYREETTVFPGDFNNKIGSGNLNINHLSENKRFLFNLSVNYSINKNFLPQTDFMSYIFMAPNAPALYDSSGKLNWENNTFFNPFANLYQQTKVRTENLVNNATAAYEIIKGLNAKVSLGFNTTRFHDNAIRYISTEMPSDITPVSRRNNNGYNNVKSWIIEPEINYSKRVNGHYFHSLAGATIQQSDRNGLVQNASGFPSDVLIENISSATTFSGYSTYSQYRYNALYARIGYNYKEKYVLNLTGRRDGSSRFGPESQFGNFGAIGAAWIFSKEDGVLNTLPFLSLGKIRGSMGRTGNDQIKDYQYLPTYTGTTGYFGTSTLIPDKIANPNYRWETINKFEAALELGFFNQRLQLNTSVYRNRTKNQLVGYSLPAITGFASVIANLPAVLQNGGVEIDITGTAVRAKDFTWIASANISIPNSKLISYPNFEASSYTTRYEIGKPLYLRYLYKFTGIDAKTGIYTFEDINKDGKINSEDRYLCNTSRKFFGGFNNTFNYKGLSLDVFLQFVKQPGYKFTPFSAPGEYSPNMSNLTTPYLNRWRSAEQSGDYQQYTGSFGSLASAAWDRYSMSDGTLVDASFIRLKNISLSWQLPNKWLRPIGLQNTRIYAQGQNLLTFTKFAGADPETQGFGGLLALPTLRVFTGGIEISL